MTTGGLHSIVPHITVICKLQARCWNLIKVLHTLVMRKMTPLHLAAGQGHIDIIKEIILYCPDCYELVDDRGWNVLHFAMASLSKKKLSSLLENPLIKKLVLVKDDKGNTPLLVLATGTRSMSDLKFFSGIYNQVGGHPLAVNKRNVSALDAFNDGYPQLEQEILALSEDIDDRPYPKGIIRLRGKYDEGYFKRMERAKESHLVAVALIATVTFAAAFTLPGGYKSEEGKNQGIAILSRNSAFQVFVITDAIAMVSSISAVFIYFIMSIERFKSYVHLFELSCWITVVAMGAMVIAFVTGTYAVLAPPSLWLAIVTCFIGMSFFILLLTMGYHIIIFKFIRGKFPSVGDLELLRLPRKDMAKIKQIRIYKLPVISFVSSWCLTQGRCRWLVLKKQLLPDCNSVNL
ncbi:hypothetical protein LWI29_017171 [Acer saccharum]|uniref:PGG domain-containing protein n=1 Tax=Acer saccharum TaxID=4024 RepID=A0AA39TF90_ACESA|nr:hypothetical protein LWI29_017171 [Acer saccharum]